MRMVLIIGTLVLVELLTACDSGTPAPTVPPDVAAIQTRTAALQALNDAQATFAAGGAQAPQPGRTALGAMTLTGPGTATAIAQAIAAVQTQLAINVAQPTALPPSTGSPTP
ncbi:MAG: hypothetical protein M3Z04_24380 [Chloroflexota bacterium]|nr:hypothetical protein [Chloroflexota bacterium]